MRHRFLRLIVTLAQVLWLGLIPHCANAAPVGAVGVCHAAGTAGEDYVKIASVMPRSDCRTDTWSIAAPRTFLRFALAAGGPVPDLFITRLTRFSKMRITVVGADGRSATRAVTMADMTPGTADWVMSTALPRLPGPVSVPVSGPPHMVIVQIDNPRHVGMLAQAHLGDRNDARGGSLAFEFGIAALCGMLCMPLVFDFAFYRVLRQRFLLWHVLAVVFMLPQTLITSGLINRIVVLSIPALCIGSATTWALGIVCAALFAADLIELDKLDPVHRALLRGTAAWIPLWTCVYLFAGGMARPWAPTAYFASFIPVLGVFIWAMAVALGRGSRAVKFQIAAMLPLMLTGTIRVVSSLGLTGAPLELQFEQHVSIALEVIITSFGVADRFLAIKRERDQAMVQAQLHAFQAGHDPLTGLLNRRWLETQFTALQASGFGAMAIIDLDHFKQVNDTHGHAVGDSVLRAVADALCPDEQTLAVRLGGEEFLLLLTGTDVKARAERRRQAIPIQIATSLHGLDHIVTASMGLVEQVPSGGPDLSFQELYEHCDRLLYEAKTAGRNRMRSRHLNGRAPASGVPGGAFGHPDQDPGAIRFAKTGSRIDRA